MKKVAVATSSKGKKFGANKLSAPSSSTSNATKVKISTPIGKSTVKLVDKDSSFKECNAFREKLRNEWNKGEKVRNMDVISQLLEEAKLKLINLKYLENKGKDIPVAEQTLARDILEIGVLFSIFKKQPDTKMFERYISQLKTYYFDYGDNVPVSPHKYEMLGANLLCLLTEGRLGDFHTELELILHPIERTEEIMNDVYIRRAIELEQALSEGRYGQVHAQDGPQKKSGLWRYFVDKLAKSTRAEIAETMEKAYEKIETKTIMERLKFENMKDLEAFAKEKKWKLKDNYCYFGKNLPEETSIPAHRLLNESLGYAKELELIV